MGVRLLLRYSYIAVLFCILQVLPGQSKAVSGSSEANYTYLVDSTGSLTLSDVHESYTALDFKKNSSSLISLGYTDHPVWIAADLPSRDNAHVLEIGVPWLHSIECFIPKKDTGFRSIESGISSDRLKHSRYLNPVFPIRPDKKNRKRLFIKVETQSPVLVPLSLRTVPEMTVADNITKLFLGLYFGFILSLIIYNFLLFISLKDKSYLYYFLFLGFLITGQFFGVYSLGIKLFPFISFEAVKSFIHIPSLLSALFALLFTRSFLSTPEKEPITDKLIMGCIYVCTAAVLLSVFVTYSNSEVLLSLMNIAPAGIMFYGGLVSYRKGYRPAVYFLSASLSTIVTFSVYQMMYSFNLFEYSPVINYVPNAGIMLSSVLFSFALAARIRESEKRLAESEEKLNLFVNSTQDYFIMTDIDLKIIEINNSALSHIFPEKGKLEIIAKSIKEAPYFFDKETVSSLSEVIKLHKTAYFEKRLLFSDNSEHIYNYSIFNAGKGLGIIISDITEHKKLQEQLIHSQKMESIGQLAGGIAHDFNNMLSVITGYADLLSKRVEEKRLQKYINNIKTSGKHAADLTAKLLSFSRKGRNEWKALDIHEILSQTCEVLHETLGKRIKIAEELDSQDHVIKGDPSELANIFYNLGINARDAMPEGGSISFRTESVRIDEEFCSRNPDARKGEFIRIDISDTGSGIDKEIQKKIFEPFFTTKPVGQGTGMGLAAVYGTVMDHKGFITLESKIGKGTTFSIYLPLHRKKVKEKETKRTETTKRSGSVLIIDDEDMVRDMITDQFEDIGYSTTAFRNPYKAIDYYRENIKEIDLIVLDMIMPEMDGEEAYYALRKLNSEVRILLASGYALNESLRRITETGLTTYIKKPFSSSELSEKLEEIF